VRYSYQSGYYSYFIKFGFGLGEDACIALALLYLCLLGCQSLRETLLQKYYFDNEYKERSVTAQANGLFGEIQRLRTTEI